VKPLLDKNMRAILAFGVFCVNFLLDRLTKGIAVVCLKEREPIILLKRMVIFTYTENTGAFLSMGANWNEHIKHFLLLIVPIIVCIGGLVYLMVKEHKIYRIITGSCVIGGGLGNLVDRMYNNFRVIDFMNFGVGKIRTGILNVADMSVTFGVMVLLIFEIAASVSLARKKPPN
jgi:signal peptidase II